MTDFSKISDSYRVAVRLHYVYKVPLCDINITSVQRDVLQRSDYLLQAYHENPKIDVWQTLFDMNVLRIKDINRNANSYTAANRDELLFRYILDVLHLPQPPEHVKARQKKQPKPKKVKAEKSNPKPESKPKPEPVSVIENPLAFLRVDCFCREYGLKEKLFRDMLKTHAYHRWKDYTHVAIFYFLIELAEQCRGMAIIKTSKKEVVKALDQMNQLIDMGTLTQKMFKYDMDFDKWRTIIKTPEEIHLINELYTEYLPERIENFVEQCTHKA